MSATLLVLHAHLPWVVDTAEERWLHEAILECYLPLLDVLEQLPGGEPRLTLSVTPVLCAMLRHEGARSRTRALLKAQVRRLRKGRSPALRAHASAAARAEESFSTGDLIDRLARCQERGAVELIGSGVTHGFLPLLSTVPQAARAQVALGVESHRRMFGVAPQGFWLPECGYAPGLSEVLKENGLRYTFVDSHAVEGTVCGTSAPVFLPSGVAAFARDPSASEQVWSSESGYPGDPVYADFHHRVDGERVLRVTGRAQKEPWEPEVAFARAREHARHFVAQRKEGEGLQVAPYDAELFGHWWLEGPVFLREVLERGDALTTGSRVLRQSPTHEMRELPFSSWGRAGNASVWLGPQNGWMWPHLHRAAEEMVTIASRPGATLALQQLLLAQASDWPFLIDAKTSAGFAQAQFEAHLMAFRALAHGEDPGRVPEPFPWVDPRVYC